jgi:hypothetical protein
MDNAGKQPGRGNNAVVRAVGGGQTLVELDSGERLWFPELEGKAVGDRLTIVRGHRPSAPVDGPAASA